MSEEIALAELLSTGLAAYQRTLREVFPQIWERLLAEMARPAPVARLSSVYNEGYLLRDGGEAAPLLALDLVTPKSVPERTYQSMLDTLPEVALLLISHRHGDHLDAEVIRRLLDAGTMVALPQDAWEALPSKVNAGKRPDNVRVVTAGASFEAAGATIRVHAAEHLSEKVRESVAYEIQLGSVTIVHAADHRGFEQGVPTWPRGADVLIMSYYHPELDDDSPTVKPASMAGMMADDAWRTRLRWDRDAALISFIQRLAPRTFVPGHIYELGHEPEKLWRFVDVALTREALFARAPEISVRSLAPGECLPLLPR
ncbi:MAG TPA: MBL fold metallo-hydrolase [Chloroflexota bacterium]|nr:MBL fold metallo-hydrolase [Chloroflexota bacterium]